VVGTAQWKPAAAAALAREAAGAMLSGNAASLLLWARHGCGPGMMHGPAQRGRTMTRRKFQTSADDTLDSGLYFTRLPGPLLLSNTGSTCAASSRQHSECSRRKTPYRPGKSLQSVL
jgi:hypothetical protein